MATGLDDDAATGRRAVATIPTAVAALAAAEQAVATRAAVTTAVAGVAATVAIGHTVATIATAMTAVTGNRLLLAAHQGQANDREHNRDSQNQRSIHPHILQN